MILQSISPLEWWANGATALCVLLAAWGRTLTWPVGILGSLLFGLLFYEARLYAELTLQVFFVSTSLLGWAQWRLAGGPPANTQRVPLQGRSLARMVLWALAVTLLYGLMLQHWTNAFAPFWDSAILASSVLAQILLMKGHRETWPAWLVVNTLSIPLYLQRELHLTAALYTAFWVNALWGWWRWQYRARPPEEAS